MPTPTAERNPPEHHDEVPPEEGLTDGALGRAMAFGFTGGTLFMFVVSVLMSLVGNADLGTAVAIAVLPGIVAGFFFGGTAWLSYEVSKSGH
jgi:hypothetical protein